MRIVLNGAGAAATAITRLLITAGAVDVTLCDRSGAIWNGRTEHMNSAKQEIAELTNPGLRKGSLAEVLAGADVFIRIHANASDNAAMALKNKLNDLIFNYSLMNGCRYSPILSSHV